MNATMALMGNPNSGKTTLFNSLTGARQHVGNYPGIQAEVTIFVCRNALRAFDIPEEDLCPGCEPIPAGVVALIKLQQQGCAYIKP